MIIDAHSHFWEPNTFKGDMVKKLQERIITDLMIRNKQNLLNGSIERLVAEMDEAGIDKTVILPVDFEFFYAEDSFTFRDFNNLAGQYQKAYPERIIAFAGVDPRRQTTAVSELRRCVEELGLQGLKLWTSTGFEADDILYYPLYEEAARLGINIMIHTGLGPSNSYLKTCRPIYVDKLAVDFRQINFIMAHAGVPWTDEALSICLKNPNVYLDLSAWQGIWLLYPVELAQFLCRAKYRYLSMHKVLFGSDWPLFSEMCPQKSWVDVIKNIDPPKQFPSMGLSQITKQDKQMILGGNAEVALGLSKQV